MYRVENYKANDQMHEVFQQIAQGVSFGIMIRQITARTVYRQEGKQRQQCDNAPYSPISLYVLKNVFHFIRNDFFLCSFLQTAHGFFKLPTSIFVVVKQNIAGTRRGKQNSSAKIGRASCRERVE